MRRAAFMPASGAPERPVGAAPEQSAARRACSRLLNLARDYPGVALRRAVTEGGAGWVRAAWVERLPARLRQRLDVDGDLVEPLRIEIGGGRFPSPGYVHVDANRASRHLEHVAPAWRLPFPDRSVHELLAIHVLEHVHPDSLDRTLSEWLRVLAPGAFAEIHVPNAATVFPAFLESNSPKKWDLLIPIFGDTEDPTLRRHRRADLERHHVIYDFDLLRRVLLAAGFDRVEDVSAAVSDRHNEGWQESQLVDRISLVARAFAPPAPAAAP